MSLGSGPSRIGPRRIGLIGFGMFGRQHAAAIGRIGPRARLVAVAEPDPARRAEIEALTGARAFASGEAMLGEVDAVCLATPHDLHAGMAIAALEAGVAVLVEKPIAPTLAEADAMLAAAARTGVPLMVAHPGRFIASIARALEMIRAGAIGRPMHARASMIKSFGLGGREAWHLNPAQGGGMWLINAVHLVERVCLLIGTPPCDVSASIGPRLHDGLRVDDTGIALFRFDGGGTGLVEAIGHRGGIESHEIFVQGTEGSLRLGPGQGLSIATKGDWVEVLAPEPDWMPRFLDRIWAGFLDHLDGAPCPVPGADARTYLAAVLAAQAAASHGNVAQITA